MITCTSYLHAHLAPHLEAITLLCDRYRVKRLWAIRSGLRKDFGADSDINFLYEWEDNALPETGYLANLWALLDSFERILGHRADCIYYPHLKNPYFMAEVEQTKVLLYEKKEEKVRF